MHEAVRRHGGESLELEGIRYGEKMEFTNFTLYRDVVMRVRDRDDGRILDLNLLHDVVACSGRYKAYVYEEN
jgi:hypothetical protein